MTDEEFIASLNDEQMLYLATKMKHLVGREVQRNLQIIFDILDQYSSPLTAGGLEVEDL